ncbi:MAG: Wzy polymerase domain-containing protein [Burkholderiales bacterium]|nr:Wzy polymerase domain-containing protein [Burkholderiales bacterium]
MSKKVCNWAFAGLLAVIAIVPFAIPYAYFPVSKFYAESTSLIAGILLFALALWNKPQLKFAPVAIASFAFAVFALIQPLFVHIYFLGNNYYVALLFFIMGLVALAITTMIDGDDKALKNMMLVLCWSLVISATIQAVIAYLQYTGKAANWSDYILVSPDNPGDGSNIFGNIGQPNQFTDFISIGVVALCYLFLVGQINLIVFIVYALLFSLAVTFTARRGVLLYYVIMLFTAGWVWLRNLKDQEKSAQFKRVALVIGGIFVGLILVQFAFPKIVALMSNSPSSVSTGIERLSGGAVNQSTYRRFYEWYKALVMFTQHPFFGVGWYQYPREGIYIMLTEQFMYIPQNAKLYTHRHNSLFNLLAETGFIGTFITIIYGIGYSIFVLLRKVRTLESLFAVLLMIPILTHSFLEYPLWYAYFMVLLIIFLAFAPAKYSLKNSLGSKVICSVVVAFLLLFAYNSYQMNTELTNYTQTPTDSDDYISNVTGLEKIVDSDSIWSLSAMMVLDNYIMPGSQVTNAVMSPADQLKYVDQLKLIIVM